MTVRELKERLEEYDDDMIICIEGDDYYDVEDMKVYDLHYRRDDNGEWSEEPRKTLCLF